jgi:hypothetical protein
MKVAVTGSSGMIGSALAESLAKDGHEVARLVRSGADPAQGRFAWDPEGGLLDRRAVEDATAVVHLAGESVAGRWTASKKRAILESRVAGTRLMAERIAAQERRPQVLVCASAIGFYGKHRADPVDEQDSGGDDFLADVVKQWEAACEPARVAGVRVVNTRFGIVLSRYGGALKAMLPAFRLGVAGRLGSGQQGFSWVAIDDVIAALTYAIDTPRLSGPVNVTAPNPVTNAEFTKTLARVLHRPAVLPAPAFAVRLALGEFSQEVLEGVRVMPKRLRKEGYEFRYPVLEPALRHVLGR